MKKYLSILADFDLKMNMGQYRSGQKLPSVREAAKSYGCSISTIIRAYTELEQRHAIYSIPQSGYYVVKETEHGVNDPLSNPRIDFASASPDISLFPYLDFQHCLNKAIDTYKYQLFTYGDTMGLKSLRQTLVSHLAGDQVFTIAERIVITSGAHQALEILSKMPFPNDRSVILVEQPSYDHFLRFLEFEGLAVTGIARTAKGINLQELEDKFKHGNIKFFYTMPRYHNPLGTTYCKEERVAIANLASKYNVYIVEDDYMADLGEVSGFEPIYAYNRSSHVVYLKSFSKIIFPGLCLGAVVLPEPLLETFCTYKKYADTSQLSQAALDIYIKNGMYERHKSSISNQYAYRLHALYEAVARHAKDGDLVVPDVASGIYAQFKLKHSVNLDRLTRRLASRNIVVVPGKPFYLSNYLEREKFLRISISRVQPEQIDEGVKAIVQELEGR